MIPARPPTPPSGSRPLTFGCVPHSEDVTVRAVLGDFCARLSELCHVPVRPHRAPSPSALASAFDAGRVDIAWASPVLVLTARELERAIPLVSSVREGEASYHSVLFTAASSTIRSPSDITQARAAWVARTSAAGFLIPRLALASRGFVPDEIFSVEAFLHSHGAVVKAVLEGDADVGATFAVFERGDPTKPLVRSGLTGMADHGEARILLAVGPIPADLMVARADVPITVRAALTTVLEHLAEDEAGAAAARTLFGTDVFQRFEPGALEPLRADVESGRALGLLDD